MSVNVHPWRHTHTVCRCLQLAVRTKKLKVLKICC